MTRETILRNCNCKKKKFQLEVFDTMQLLQIREAGEVFEILKSLRNSASTKKSRTEEIKNTQKLIHAMRLFLP